MSTFRQILARVLGGRAAATSTSIRATEMAADLANLQLIDVREPDEWKAGHIAGAIHIPMGRLQHSIGSIDAGRRVAVICRSGVRSKGAARLLRGHSIDAASVRGGMLAWARAGLPVVRGTGAGGKGQR